jgi:hypothetical protein
VAYGKIEVMFEEGMCEVDLFVQDAEGARINDKCVLGARGCAVHCGCVVGWALPCTAALCCAEALTLSAPLLPWVTPRGPQCVKCSRGGGCRCAATQYNTEVLPTSPQAGGLKLWSPTLF